MVNNNLKLDKSLFGHEYRDDFKSSQIDPYGVIGTVGIMEVVEWAKNRYLFDIGVPKRSSFYKSSMVLKTISTQAEYYRTANFADDFIVHTRISYLKISSVGMEHIIELADGTPIANVKNDMIFLNAQTREQQDLSESIKHLVNLHEGKKVK